MYSVSVMLDEEADTMRRASLSYVRLISPLLPPSKLAVQVIGRPHSRTDESFRDKLVRVAADARAHRVHGTATLQVRFDTTESSIHGADATIAVPEVTNPVRRLKVMLALFVLLVMTCALLQRKTLRRRRPAAVRHKYVRW